MYQPREEFPYLWSRNVPDMSQRIKKNGYAGIFENDVASMDKCHTKCVKYLGNVSTRIHSSDTVQILLNFEAEIALFFTNFFLASTDFSLWALNDNGNTKDLQKSPAEMGEHAEKIKSLFQNSQRCSNQAALNISLEEPKYHRKYSSLALFLCQF